MNERILLALQKLNELQGTADTSFELSGNSILKTTRVQERFQTTFMQMHEVAFQAESEQELLEWITAQLPAEPKEKETSEPAAPTTKSKK